MFYQIFYFFTFFWIFLFFCLKKIKIYHLLNWLCIQPLFQPKKVYLIFIIYLENVQLCATSWQLWRIYNWQYLGTMQLKCYRLGPHCRGGGKPFLKVGGGGDRVFLKPDKGGGEAIFEVENSKKSRALRAHLFTFRTNTNNALYVVNIFSL